jgi:hypothetical protein
MLGHFVPGPAGRLRAFNAWPKDYRLIERDVQELVKVQDLDRFDTFARIASERSGQVLDQQQLARLAGTSRSTVVRWLAVLDDCFLTLRIPPCDYDLGRRLIRSPKLHFLQSESFESSVVSEIYRNAVHTGTMPDLRYWRDSNGLELALVPAELISDGRSNRRSSNPTLEIRLQRYNPSWYSHRAICRNCSRRRAGQSSVRPTNCEQSYTSETVRAKDCPFSSQAVFSYPPHSPMAFDVKAKQWPHWSSKCRLRKSRRFARDQWPVVQQSDDGVRFLG